MSLSKSRFIEMFIDNKQKIKLGEVCNLINGDRGKNYPSQSSFVECGIPFVNAGHLSEKTVDFSSMNFISEERYSLLNSGKVQNDDILYCLRGSLGKFALVDFKKGAIASSLVIIRCDQTKIIPKFLMSELESNDIKIQLQKMTNGSSQPNLSANSVKNFLIRLPSIEHQLSYVSFLKQIDKSKFLLQKILEKLELLKKSRFIEMFGNPNTNSLNLPEKPIKNVCQNLDYKREPITSSERVKGKYPYYGASGIVDWVDNFIFDDDLLLVSEDGENLSARVTPIAFSIKGKTWVNNHAHVLKFDDLYMQNYVEYFFNQLDLTSKITGTAQPKFNQKALNETMLPIPSIESLVHFKNLCNQIDKSKLVIQKSLEDLVGKS